MNNAIWKFPLERPDAEGAPPAPRARFLVEMPRGAEVLSTELMGGVVTVWALVNPEAPTVRRTLEVFATGDVDVAGKRFIGTVINRQFVRLGERRTKEQLAPLVWHVFDAGESPSAVMS